MTWNTLTCPICGFVFWLDDESRRGSDESRWEARFRIIYRCLATDTAAVTGLGLYEPRARDHFRAPLEPDRTWRDGSLVTIVGPQNRFPIRGRHGLPIHDACWRLLAEACRPWGAVPVANLMDVLQSLPWPLNPVRPQAVAGVDWGRDIEGCVMTDRNRPRMMGFTRPDLPERLLFVSSDPHNLPELRNAPDDEPCEPPSLAAPPARTDGLAEFPLEILLMIASYLPMRDILTARLALPSFYSLFHSQLLWASRFRLGWERDWVFEARRWTGVRDWRWIYRITATGTGSGARAPAMENRRRVWRLVQQLQRALGGVWAGSQTLPVPNVNTTQWWQVSGHLQKPQQMHAQAGAGGLWDNFFRGCRKTREQHTLVPQSRLRAVRFYFTQHGDTEYVAGLRLEFDGGLDIQLGYQTETQRGLAIAKTLNGFAVAAGMRGIQSIRCVFDDGEASDWLGASQAPVTTRLILSSSVTAIRAGFDGCKMVSIGVTGDALESEPYKGLRNTALWHPGLPRDEVHLNEQCFAHFTTRAHLITHVEPLRWTSFGGPGGARLRHLVRITVDCTALVQGVRFHYDDAPSEPEARPVYGLQDLVMEARWELYMLQSLHFDIDGPAGEVVDSVTAYNVADVFQPCGLKSLKMTTNWGRSHHFATYADKCKPTARTLRPAPGTAITGFYWVEGDFAMTALGIMSEPLHA
jgi:hypothetical protein